MEIVQEKLNVRLQSIIIVIAGEIDEDKHTKMLGTCFTLLI